MKTGWTPVKNEDKTMPNIEIHGLPFTIPGEAKKALKLQASIWIALRRAHFINEVVITNAGSHVTDHNGQSQPFVRVWSNDQKEVDYIVWRLHRFIDVEVPPLLTKYVPRQSAQERREDLQYLQV